MRVHPAVAVMAATASIAASLAVAPASTAGAANPPAPAPVNCPTSLPTSDAVDGVTGTGWTVERGTTPEPFTAIVLGRLTDGIAPGVDMIMADLDSLALRRAGGVWAGMSGSPVYATDGRLIGSVSYGLAASSPIAGLTPAEALGTLLTADPDDALAGARTRIGVGPQAARRLARTGEVTSAEAARGFTRLPMPLTVSGLGTSRAAERISARLQRSAGVRVTIGAATVTARPAPRPLGGGGNVAAAVAYGDATLSAVGTTTFTCSDRAVAFGHPFLDAGVTTYSAHGATALYVQPDPVNGPFKVANLGAVVGVVDRDRTLGLRIDTSRTPRGTSIVSTLTRVETGSRRTGRTVSLYQPLTPDAAAIHTLLNVDRVLGSGAAKGTARVGLRIRGATSKGTPFDLRTSDVFVAPTTADALGLQVADWVYAKVAALVRQPFDELSIRTIELTGTIGSQNGYWRAPSVVFYQGGRWVPGTQGVVVRAGQRVWSRTTLRQYQRPTTTTLLGLVLRVPAGVRYRAVELVVAGGSAEGASAAEPASLAALLAQLRATPRSDTVRLEVRDLDTGVVYARNTVRATLPVAAFERSYPLVVQ